MKTIILIDMYVGGHHLMYLRLCSKILLELGHRVITFSPNVNALFDWILAHSPENIARIKVYAMQQSTFWQLPGVRRLPQPLHILARWRQASALVYQACQEMDVSVDLVYFNWLDSYLSRHLNSAIIDTVFPFPWAGLWFLPPVNALDAATATGESAVGYPVFTSKYCRRVGVLDEQMRDKLQQQTSTPIFFFPDVTDDAAPDHCYPVLAQLKTQAKNRKIIGLLGSLHRRKGLLTLLETALQSQGKDWFFAFIGQLASHSFNQAELTYLQQVMYSAPNNCFFHLKMIPDEPQFNALVQACDILFAAYEDFPYSSNILAKAAAFEKPVIATQGGCIGERVESFCLGQTIPTGDVAACREAIGTIILDFLSLHQSQNQKQPDFARYLQDHGLERAQKCLQDLLVAL